MHGCAIRYNSCITDVISIGQVFEYMDAKFLEAVCLASIEILGEKQTFQVLKGLGIASYSRLEESRFSLERFGRELAARYDPQTARGLLIRIGRASLIFLRRYFSEISELGGIDNRLKPLEKRFPFSLGVLAQKMGEAMGAEIQASVADSQTYKWCLDAPDAVFEPFYHFGLLEEFCAWLDARKDYQIAYAPDSADPDYAELVIQVKEKE